MGEHDPHNIEKSKVDAPLVPASDFETESPLSETRGLGVTHNVTMEISLGDVLVGTDPSISQFELRAALESYLHHERPEPSVVSGLAVDENARVVAEALLGNNKTRPRGWKPTEGNILSIRETVERAIESGNPIEGITFFGAVKNLGVLPHRTHADLADFQALARFNEIDRAVRETYERGIRARIILEDLGEEFLVGASPELFDQMERYTRGLRDLAMVVAPGVVVVERESETFASLPIPEKIRELFCLESTHGITKDLFMKVAQENYLLFKEYLKESRERGVIPVNEHDTSVLHEEIPAYKALSDLGWRGCIPVNQREYYFARAGNEFGKDRTEAELEDRVARYLGAAFARGRLGLGRGTYEDVDGTRIAPLKLSFVQYPPGTPRAIEQNRVEYKIGNENKGSSKVPPWCGTGGFSIYPKGLRVATEGFAGFDEVELRQEVKITFTRHDADGGKRSITLQADISRPRSEMQ